jgi:DNA-binding transcriptional ArsR family regulator
MENVAKIFKALNDETRLNILLLVSKTNICQKGISKYLGISDSAVSQHIKVLKDSQLINGYKEGYYILYYLNEGIFNKCINFIRSISDTENILSDITVNLIGCSSNCKSAQMCCKRKGLL